MTKTAVVAILIAGLLAGTSVAHAEELTAQQVLERMADTYAKAETYSARGMLSFEMTSPFGAQSVVARQQAAYQRPNRAFVQSGLGMGRQGVQTVVCDGRHVYKRIDVLDQYTKAAAPRTLSEIRDLGEEEDTPEGYKAILDVPALLDGVDLKERVTEVTLERTGRYFGTPVYILALKIKGGHQETLWVGQDDFLIRRLTFRMNMDEMIAGMKKSMEESLKQSQEQRPEGEAEQPGEAKEGGETPAEGGEAQPPEDFMRAMMEQMMESFSKMEMSITQRFTEVSVDSDVPDSVFRFHLRPGERRVRKLDEVPMPEEEPTEMPEVEEPPAVDLTGKEAPDFTLNDLADTPVTLSKLRGKPVLLDFWASWCGPCRMELPHVQELYTEYAGKGLQVVAVSVDAAVDDAKKAVEEDKLTFPILWTDPSSAEAQQIMEAYGVSGIPRLLLIDANGIVQADMTGYHEKAQLVEALAKVGL
jgi:thiol-disulfide isomerase/thioredoxin/outer membrane lipoprotein-sorting protein